MNDNYFFNVAMAARARGFVVTPLRDKRPFLPAWNKHPLRTETEILTAAEEYPTCDVGVVRQITNDLVTPPSASCRGLIG